MNRIVELSGESGDRPGHPQSVAQNNKTPEPANSHAMKMENAIRILAGAMVLISISLAHWVNEWWLLLAGFVGVNLIQSSLTGFCPAENIFRKLGIGKGDSACGR